MKDTDTFDTYGYILILKENKYQLAVGDIVRIPIAFANEGLFDGWAEKIEKSVDAKIFTNEYFQQQNLKQSTKKAPVFFDLLSSLANNYAKSIGAIGTEEKITSELKIVQAKVLQHFLMKRRDDATDEVVKYLRENHFFATFRIDEKQELWKYYDGIWVPNGETFVIEFCRILFGNVMSSQLVSNVLLKLRSETFVDPELFIKNDKPHLVCIENGVYDLLENKLLEHDPKYRFMQKLPVKFDSTAQCPDLFAFLQSTLDEQDILTLQEWFGFCMYREYKYKKAMMLTGATNNGKSKVLQLLSHFLGEKNVCHVALHKVEDETFVLSEFFGKLANIFADLPDKSIYDDSSFKMLTGLDPIGGDRKYKSRINFVNYAKLIFSANDLPRIVKDGDSFWGRWILIEFPHRFYTKIEIAQMPEEQQKVARLQNPDILKNILTENGLSAVLNWAIEGFRRLQINSGFTESRSSKEIKDKWTRKANSLIAFINDAILYDYSEEKCIISKNDFLQAYSEYCRMHSIRLMNGIIVKKTLDEKGIFDEQITWDGNRDRYWVNICFKNDVIDYNIENSGDLRNIKKINFKNYRREVKMPAQPAQPTQLISNTFYEENSPLRVKNAVHPVHPVHPHINSGIIPTMVTDLVKTRQFSSKNEIQIDDPLLLQFGQFLKSHKSLFVPDQNMMLAGPELEKNDELNTVIFASKGLLVHYKGGYGIEMLKWQQLVETKEKDIVVSQPNDKSIDFDDSEVI